MRKWHLWVCFLVILTVLPLVGCEQRKLVVEDKEVPSVLISTPANGARVSGTVTIAGLSSDLRSGVAQVEVKIDTGNWQLASGTTSWLFTWNTASVSDGAHTIQARATDLSGNTGTSTTITVTVDNTAPILTVTSHENVDYVKGGTIVTISGTATDPNGGIVSSVEVRIDNGSWELASGTTNWSFNWSTDYDDDNYYDAHTVAIRASDSLGLTTTTIITLYVDNNHPWIDKCWPSQGYNVPTGANILIVFRGGPMDRASVENNFRLIRMGTTTPVSGKFYWRTGFWQEEELCIFAPDGYLVDNQTYKVFLNNVNVTDRAGNLFSGSLNYTFQTRDCTPPTIVSRDPDKNAVLDAFNPGLATIKFSEHMGCGAGVNITDNTTGNSWGLPAVWLDPNTRRTLVAGLIYYNGGWSEANDDKNQFSNWGFNNVIKGYNTDPDGKLYVTYYASSWPRYLYLYKDSARTQLVAYGGYWGDSGWYSFWEQNNSGLSGACYVNRVADDNDIELTLNFSSYLQEGRNYTIRVFGNDSGGLPIEEDKEWIIYTKQNPANDTNPPAVVDILPANSATGIMPRRLIHLVFSEVINPESFSTSDLTITDGSGGVSYQWEMYPDEGFTRLALYPNRNLSGTVTVNLKKDSIEDLAGNKGPTSAFTSTFTVSADTTAPSVVWVLPADGSKDIDMRWNVNWPFSGGVGFSERMSDSLPSDALTVVEAVSGAPVKGLRLRPMKVKEEGMLGGSSVMTIE
ncbi:MAG: Ig-like domain-containing protein, partial [Planctomycetota bacterium]|nr:Ig-like domain-containing protein [Planctomycetota bacterium]